jgi:regulator of protease activity HflC (stomatin/prohibitin superfamily)
MFKQMISILIFMISMNNTNAIYSLTGFHKCPQGHRCIYYRGDAMIDRVSHPGWRWQEPFLSTPYAIQTTIQTDTIPRVVCGSSKGGTAYITVEIVNKLLDDDKCIEKVVKQYGIYYDKQVIYDFVPSEVAQFCKSYDLDELYIEQFDKLDEVLHNKLTENVDSFGLSECLKIIKVRLGRPELSPEQTKQFERTELLKKQQEHAREEAATAAIKSKTDLAQAEADAKKVQMTKKYEMETLKLKAQNDASIQEIEDLKNKKTIESTAEAKSNAIKYEAEANKHLHSPEYIKLKHTNAIFNNAKIIDAKLMSNSHSLMYMDNN